MVYRFSLRNGLDVGNFSYNGDDVSKYLTIKEAADIARMHPKSIEKKIKTKEIRAFKPGKCWIIDEKDLLDFIRRHKAA